MKINKKQNNLLKTIALILTVIGGVALSLLNRWEPGGETWGYWFFARVFAETGEFIIPQRSPIYTVYLNGFRWLGYPDMVTAEFIVTSLIVVAAIVVLFRPYLGLGTAAFAALVWLPFLQVSEPPVQMLALACSCLAVVARRAEGDRFKFSVSYALLGLAYMFRTTYIVLILLFVGWDIIKIVKQNKIKFISLRPKLNHDWPIILVVGLFILFVVMQSSHPWNNGHFANTTWFPSQAKTVTEASFIQNYNWQYIELKYGTFVGHDFYFTNQELFRGATTIVGAIVANPQFVIEQLGRNALNAITIVVNLTMLLGIYLLVPFSGYLALFAFIPMLYGAFRASKEESIILLVKGTLLLLGTAIIGMPKTRYMTPFIPVLILSGYWYGTQLNTVLTMKMLRESPRKILLWAGLIGIGLVSLFISFYLILGFVVPPSISHVFWFFIIIGYIILFFFVVFGKYGSRDNAQRCLTLCGNLAVPVTLVVFSISPFMYWAPILQDNITNFDMSKVRVIERNDNYSIKSSFATIEPLIQDCNGIMSLEPTFIGAFMNVPLNRLYDVWEIPPFEHLGDPVYDGLRPDRIDCILISYELSTGIGAATNYQIRYQNYIKPYIKELREMGATTYQIKGFGQAIILRNETGFGHHSNVKNIPFAVQ